jgi:hypothetical protein
LGPSQARGWRAGCGPGVDVGVKIAKLTTDSAGTRHFFTGATVASRRPYGSTKSSNCEPISIGGEVRVYAAAADNNTTATILQNSLFNGSFMIGFSPKCSLLEIRLHLDEVPD